MENKMNKQTTERILEFVRRVDRNHDLAHSVLDVLLCDNPSAVLAAYDNVVAQSEVYDMVIGHVGVEKIKAIKMLRVLTGLGLAQAKNVVEGNHSPIIKEGVTKEEAAAIWESASAEYPAGVHHDALSYTLVPAGQGAGYRFSCSLRTY